MRDMLDPERELLEEMASDGLHFVAGNAGFAVGLDSRAAWASERLGFGRDPVPLSGRVTDDDTRRLMGLSDGDMERIERRSKAMQGALVIVHEEVAR